MRDDKIITNPNGFKFIKMPSGKFYSFTEAVHAADLAESAFARAIARAFDLRPDWTGEPERADYRDMDLERIEWALDSMEAYLHAAREHLEKERGAKSQEDRITKLREIAGRTPEEAEAFQEKADQLEEKLRSR